MTRTRAGCLAWLLRIVIITYLATYVWPTRWQYDHIGGTPIRTERVTGRVQFCNFYGWQWQLPIPEDHARLPQKNDQGAAPTGGPPQTPGPNAR